MIKLIVSETWRFGRKVGLYMDVVKTLTPKIKKKPSKTCFMKKTKNPLNTLNKNVVDKFKKLFKPNEKTLQQNYCLSVL